MAREYDHLLKIVVIGDTGVGKSSLMLRYTDKIFEFSYIPTIGVDFRFKTIKVGDETVKIQIWDTAGQERFRTITTTYYRGAHGVIVVYDCNDPNSFDKVKIWLDEIDRNCYGVSRLLVGNKDDQPEKKAISTIMASKFALESNIELIETSALKNINVGDVFRRIASMSLKLRREQQQQRENALKLNYKLKKKGFKKCC